ncbi:uncharacterized protein LOC125226216 [Leguminivora glycinivorella]|uniref:uncharacterized protein LOC125226216 n=1 Tax=Leguminivora glycinivorella TaxID=1035111 RepID=UPI00200D96EF|nr:uncharacterized protein LOC125226216 [Leguminivora glycinivorella]
MSNQTQLTNVVKTSIGTFATSTVASVRAATMLARTGPVLKTRRATLAAGIMWVTGGMKKGTVFPKSNAPHVAAVTTSIGSHASKTAGTSPATCLANPRRAALVV